MDTTLWSLLATLIFILISAIIVFHRNIIVIISHRLEATLSRSTPLPFGSLGWPFIGETLEFISCAYSDFPESFMDKRRLLYGNVFKSHILGSPTIISTDAEVSRSILQSDATTFVPFYPKSLTELMGKSSILVINGSLQRKVHGLIGAFIKSPQVKARITHDMQKYVQQAMVNWQENCPVYIQHQAKNITFQVLVKALIGINPGDELEFLRSQFKEFIAGLVSLPIKIPGSTLYRSLQAKKRMVKLIQRIIQEKRDKNGRTVTEDVADVFLNNTSEELTTELISDNIIDLMIPGEDSIPMLITLAIKYLSDCPTALRQLTEENLTLKRMKENKEEMLEWNDYLSLPFTQNVISETLRLGNIIVGVMRKAVKDVEIKGYLIPKGWCIFTYFRSVHLDENHYDFPYQFNPWRWQNRDINNCNFTPFGGGQRLCPGLELARLEASIFLHHFTTQFSWVAEEDSAISFPTVRMKRGMPVWIRRREQ